ncbi:protein kinase [candidate division CSSED10-310 bacterium]|uniref:Protein kinase n=1 Tax=candidate division CSSED10-310 bacterium TaxID=2855610 RepID=A0ABV6YTA1_UNCC1
MISVPLIAQRFEFQNKEENILGRGGMGDVYRGRDTSSGDIVAIKVLQKSLSANQDHIERFRREGEALRHLNHPNIVKIFDFIEDQGQSYLVMEYVAGGSLRALLDKKKQVPTSQVVEIGLDLSDALTRAHRLGIIHRDLKPANVLLAPDGTPRLTDFGIAHMAETPRLTKTGVVVGTAEYLSPEVCRGDKIDSRSDIWAFGVMLYEMLTGVHPFTAPNVAATINAIITQQHRPLHEHRHDVPDDLVSLIDEMLEKDLRDRIYSIRLVGIALEKLNLSQQGTGDLPDPLAIASETDSRFAIDISTAPQFFKHNLSSHRTLFVGRETELEKLDQLLNNPAIRLITILGGGGTGKTCLAHEAAFGQLENFQDGVYFIPLAAVSDGHDIPTTIAEAINFAFFEGGDPGRQLLDYVQNKDMLLFLDNFEHLITAVQFVLEILKVGPGIKLVITSRIRLKVQAEHLFPVTGLDFPDEDANSPSIEDCLHYSAVKLFVKKAEQVSLPFKLTSDNLAAVISICRQVRGLPLAIIIAACWIEVLNPEEIAAEIKHNIDFLESDLQDIPDRQRSIRAVFEYSWGMLSEPEKDLFQKLAVFHGGFNRAAAAEIARASLKDLISLVNKSLIFKSAIGRYEMHDLIRHYAWEQLTRTPEVRQELEPRYSDFYASLINTLGQELISSRQQTTLEQIDLDKENFRTAWIWAIKHHALDHIQKSIDATGRYFRIRWLFQVGAAAMKMVVDMVEPDSSPQQTLLFCKASRWQALFSLLQGDTGQAQEYLERCLGRADLRATQDQDFRQEKAYFSLVQAATVAHTGERKKAWTLGQEAIDLFRSVQDQWGLAETLDQTASIAISLGQFEKSKQLLEESLTLKKRIGDQRGIAQTLRLLGRSTLMKGKLDQGSALLRESIVICQEIGDKAQSVLWMNDLGVLQMYLGEFQEAHKLLQESLHICRDLGNNAYSALVQSSIGNLKAHLGDYEDARRQAELGLSLSRQGDFKGGMAFALFIMGGVAMATKQVEKARDFLQESVAILKSIKHQDQLVISLAVLGGAYCDMGHSDKALETFWEALCTANRNKAYVPLLVVLSATACYLARRGDETLAIEVYALTSQRSFVAKSSWFRDTIGQHIEELKRSLSAAEVNTLIERGKKRELEPTVQEIMDHLQNLRKPSA